MVNNGPDPMDKEYHISATLNLSVVQEESPKTKSRALTFDVTETGLPKLNLEGKTEVTIQCLFYHTKSRTFASAPLRFKVVDKNKVSCVPSQRFTLTMKKDDRLNYPSFASQLPEPTEDAWYVLGIISDNVESNFGYRDQNHWKNFSANLQGTGVKFNSSFAQVTPGQQDKVELNIPYAFLWRKLNATDDGSGNYTFTAEKPALIKPMGTIVRLNVTNKTNYKLKYNGLTLISSGSTSGTFVLELARYLDTQHQAPASIEDAETNAASIATAYNEMIKAMWIDNSTRGKNELAFTNYKFKNETDVKLDNNQKDPTTYWVWFMPKAAKIGGAFNAAYKKEIQKTQFFLHSKADQDDAPEMAMLPVYGSKELYESGNTYPANGKALYDYGPLNFVAEKNSTANGSFSNDLGQAKQFSPEDMGKLDVPTGYHIPTRMEWQTIFARYAGMGYMQELVAINPGTLNGQSNRFAVYVGKNNNIPEKLPTAYQHIVTMAKWPKHMGSLKGNVWNRRYRAEPETGYCWHQDGTTFGQDYGSLVYGSSFNMSHYPALTSDQHKCAIRIDYADMSKNPTEKARLVLTQRYLGPNYVLGPFDIQDDQYWKYTGRTDLTPLTDEFQRSLPMYGFALHSSYKEAEPRTTAQNFGLGAIYWSNTEERTENILGPKSTSRRLPLYLNIDDNSMTDNLNNLCEWPTYKLGGGAHNSSDKPIVTNYSAFVRLFTNTPQKR